MNAPNPSVLMQNPLAAAGLPGLSAFSPQEVQAALQQSLQQQAIQQLAVLQQNAASQFGPQAQQMFLHTQVNFSLKISSSVG